MLGRIPFAITATGQHGVTIFFVLSGFLITSKLLDGDISLPKFYIRRFFRIVPMASLYLVAVGFLALISRQQLFARGELLSCLLFYRNYFHQHGSGLVAHFWSLSVEEQFYLLWPAVLFFCGRRNALRAAILGALACVVARSVFFSYYDRLWFNLHTEVRADALLAGCILAIAIERAAFAEWIGKNAKAITFLSLVLLPFCWWNSYLLPSLPESVAVAALIGVSVLRPACRFATALAWRPLVSLGVISYGVYLWQQFVFCLNGNAARAIGLLLLPAFVWVLHDLIEKPTIAMGRRLTAEKDLVLAKA